MPGFIGFPELLLLGLVVLLVFGPKRLPEMGRSMGRGLREFKNSVSSDHTDGDRFAIPQEETEPAQVVAVSASSPVAPAPEHALIGAAHEHAAEKVA